MSPEELEHARCVMESHEALKKQTGRALLAHIDVQAKQIETLKAACHTYLQKAIRLDHPDRSLESANVAAKSQLARELPAIFGEDA